MTSIRNLPLAARLGGAFGVLCLALAIVAFTGMSALSGLRAKTDEPRRASARRRGTARRHAAARQGQRRPHRPAPVRHRRRPGRPGRALQGDRGQLGPEQGRRRQARAALQGLAPSRTSSPPGSRTRAEMVEAAEAGARGLARRDGGERRGPQRRPATLYERQLLPLDDQLEAAGDEAHRRHQPAAATARPGSARPARQRRAPDAHRRGRRDPARDRARRLGHALGRPPGHVR